jgi:hypothetical protein
MQTEIDTPALEYVDGHSDFRYPPSGDTRSVVLALVGDMKSLI